MPVCWLPDLRKWASIVATALGSGGSLYLADAHPAARVFDDETAAPIAADVLGRAVRYQQITFDALKAQLLGSGMSESFAQGYVDMMRAKDEGMDMPHPARPKAARRRASANGAGKSSSQPCSPDHHAMRQQS